MPFLLGLACASNIGSAATLIGYPQNMLIGEVLKLPFAGYMADAIVPVLAGLLALWALLAWQMRRTPPVAEPDPAQLATIASEVPPFDRWQTAKGLFVVNHALERTGLTPQLVAWLTTQGIDFAQPATLFFTTLGLSNLVSNVPAVMVLMPLAKVVAGWLAVR